MVYQCPNCGSTDTFPVIPKKVEIHGRIDEKTNDAFLTGHSETPGQEMWIGCKSCKHGGPRRTFKEIN